MTTSQGQEGTPGFFAKIGTNIYWGFNRFGFSAGNKVTGQPQVLIVTKVGKDGVPREAALMSRMKADLVSVGMETNDPVTYRCFDCLPTDEAHTGDTRRFMYCARCGTHGTFDTTFLRTGPIRKCPGCDAELSTRTCRHWHTWGHCFCCAGVPDTGGEIFDPVTGEIINR